MKGMMSLLERAGLVRQEGMGSDEAASVASSEGGVAPGTETQAAEPVPATSEGQTLEQVYAAAQVPPCNYPAERLLRLLGGLSAMDEAMRRQTIHTIDAADESWTIDDPLRDAAAKVTAIEQHASGLRAGLGQAEQEAQAELTELRTRQDSAVADVKRQISDLEGLMAREIARSAQQCAAVEATLQARRETVSQELGTLSRAASEFRVLIGQFKTNLTS